MKNGKMYQMVTMLAAVMVVVLVALPMWISYNGKMKMRYALNTDTVNAMKLDVPLQKQVVVVDTTYAQAGQRSVNYQNLGGTVVTPQRYNINTFGAKDYQTLGEAPWGLLDTVSRNADDAEIIRYVFNNKVVNDAFLGRDDVKPLVYDSKALYAVIQNEDALKTFFDYKIVQAALDKPAVIDAIAGSRIMDSILRGDAAQYFLNNPKTSAALIAKSPTLTMLKNNPAIAKAFRNNKYTAPAAAVILK